MSTIAGLDTATDDVSVAVIRDARVVDERLLSKPEGGRPRHAEMLLVELMEPAKAEPAQPQAESNGE